MPEQQGVTGSPPAQSNAVGEGSLNKSPNIDKGGQKKKGSQCDQRGSPQPKKFKGKHPPLESYVYDAGLPNSNQDIFAMMMHEIAESVSRKYKEAWEFWLGLINQNLSFFIASGSDSICLISSPSRCGNWI